VILSDKTVDLLRYASLDALYALGQLELLSEELIEATALSLPNLSGPEVIFKASLILRQLPSEAAPSFALYIMS
jgi:hypothetical protein